MANRGASGSFGNSFDHVYMTYSYLHFNQCQYLYPYISIIFRGSMRYFKVELGFLPVLLPGFTKEKNLGYIGIILGPLHRFP